VRVISPGNRGNKKKEGQKKRASGLGKRKERGEGKEPKENGGPEPKHCRAVLAREREKGFGGKAHGNAGGPIFPL